MQKAARRERYHHGDLRRALMDAALTHIADDGFDGFTMAEAAREAGVSSGAPYRHFPDRAALLGALADEAADLLDAAVQQAIEGAGDDPWRQLTAVGEAHVAFALSHPAHVRVLHRREALDLADPEVRDEVEDATARWRAAAGHRQAAVRLAAQAAVYGLARMVVDGHVHGLTADEATAATRAVLATLRR